MRIDVRALSHLPSQVLFPLAFQCTNTTVVDVYDVPAPSTQIASAPDEDGGADERLAEQFRQQYLDDLAQRRKKKRAPAPTRQQQPVGDVLKGPKLGGSRNSRAAVRDMLLKQEKEKGGR